MPKTIKLTADEKKYLNDNLSAIKDSARLEPAQKERAKYLVSKLKGATPLQVSRVDARYMQGIAKMALKTLTDVVQPEYKRRMTSPELIQKYQPYVVKNEAKVKMLENLLKKIEGVL